MELEEVASGYCFVEAPRWDGRSLWFSDLLGGGLHRLWPDRRVDTFLPDKTRIGGAVVNVDGAIVCSGFGGLAWLQPATGASGMLLESIDGEPIRRVNDMYPDGKGGLYFGTSPMPSQNTPGPTLTSLYRLDSEGRATLLQDGVHLPNGIGLSPDGRRLYVNESLVGTFVYDVLEDVGLANKDLFCGQKDCDGLAVDAEGGVWIACFDSAAVIRLLPDGTEDRRITVPVRNATSVCFGGTDWRDLYIATAGNEGVEGLITGNLPPRAASLYRIRSDIAGLPVLTTRFALPA